MLDSVAYYVQPCSEIAACQGEVVNGGVKGGKGVYGTSRRLNLFCNLANPPFFGPLKEHMLKYVGYPGLGVLFIGTPHHDPHLEGDHRRAFIFLKYDGKAVGEGCLCNVSFFCVDSCPRGKK